MKQAIVTDIEGTTSSIAFVKDVLFPYARRELPRFVREGGPASWDEIAQGLDLTGHFLLRDVLTDRAKSIAEARMRLVERLRRAGGLA